MSRSFPRLPENRNGEASEFTYSDWEFTTDGPPELKCTTYCVRSDGQDLCDKKCLKWQGQLENFSRNICMEPASSGT